MMKNTIIKFFTGSAISQVLGLISILIVSLGNIDEDISTYAYYLSVMTLISLFYTLRMENFVFRIDKLELNSYVFALIILAALVFFISEFVVYFIVGKEQFYFWAVTCLGAFFYSLHNIYINVLVRCAETNAVVRIKLYRSVMEVIVVIFSFVFKLPIYYYLIAYCLSYFISTISYFFWFSNFKSNDFSFSSIRLGFNILKLNLKHMKFDFPASLFNVGLLQFPQLFLHSTGNSVYSVIYFQFNKFVTTPLVLVSQSIGLALKQHAQQELDLHGTVDSSISQIRQIFSLKKAFILFFLVTLFSVVLSCFFGYEFEYFIFVFLPLITLSVFRFDFNCFSSLVYVRGLYFYNFLFQLLSLFFIVLICYLVSVKFFIMSYSLLLVVTYYVFTKIITRRVDA